MPPIPIGGPFKMPMYKEWFPETLRPWCYLLMAVIFQLTSGVYLGNVAHYAGEWSLMREDVLFIGMCGVIGVNMPFPLLFKFKFRFTNQQLLINATTVVLMCNFGCMYVRSIPLLCLLSFLAGFFKLCATFECFSNIQLWMTPKRDFAVFFPLLYIIVLGDISLQSWLAVQISERFDSWQMMHWLVIGLLLCCLLFQVICLKPFRMMLIPWKSVDWLGLVMWSLCFVGVVWIFNYGEYYNWADSKTFCDVCVMTVVLLLFNVGRMWHIRHPYISLEPFTIKPIFPLLLMYVMGEWFNATSKSLGNIYMGGVMHWGALTTSVLELVSIMGTVCGCLFTLMWIKAWHQKYTRLLSVGFLALLMYQVFMYFLVSPQSNIELFYCPTLLRTFGYAIFFTACTIHLEELLTFQTFFMGFTITGIVRNGPVASLISGIYAYNQRRLEADVIARGLIVDHQDLMLIAIKQLFGATCLIGSAFFILMLLYNVNPVRSTLKRMPSWFGVGKKLRREESHSEHMRHKTAIS